MSEVLPEALAAYLVERDNQRATAIAEVLASLTDRERGILHDAAVMGYVQGLQRSREEGAPKDSQTVALVIDACLALPDLYPTINGSRASHPITSSWTVESPRRENWTSWGAPYDDPEQARESYDTAIDNSPRRQFRVVRADTTYTVVAEHAPDDDTAGES